MTEYLNILIILPIIIPFLTSIIMLITRKNATVHKYLNFGGALLSLAVSVDLFLEIYTGGIHAVTIGSWMPPFGITIVADLFSAVMVFITALIGLSTAVFSIVTIDRERTKFFYYPLLQILIMGINGAFLTGDIFNMYVWFEVMLISSFVLLALGGTKKQLEGSIKYVTINLISSGFFLAGVGILFGIAGSLNMADLAVKLPVAENQGMVTVVSLFFLISFGIKSAVFPMFFWLPSSYHTPPAAVSAIFAGMLTKVGVYSMIRVYTLMFTNDSEYIHTIILVIAVFTMVTGVLGAAAQMEFRKILSFHIISQIGYMIMGLGFFTPLAIAGSVFYIVHHIIVKANLFFISGIVNEMKGTYLLKKLGGMYKMYPLLGLLFLVPALSLGGIPPLSGFWAKFMLVKAGLETSEYLVVGISLFVGLLTLFSMTKIWNEVFWKDKPDDSANNQSAPAFKEYNRGKKILLFAPAVILAAFTVYIGINVESVFSIAEQASEQILNPQQYIEAVLGGAL